MHIRSFPFVMAVGVSAIVSIASVGCSKKDPDASPAGSASVTVAMPNASGSAASNASGSAAASASAAPKEDPDACPKDNKPPAFTYADVKFTWSEKPALADAPKDKAYANVGGKTFELPKVELWVSEKRGEFDVRTNDGVLLGPTITIKGVPKAGFLAEEKFGSNRGYFQMPKKGDTAECHRQTTSFNGENARVVKIDRYDGKTADFTFVTTWKESYNEKRHMWAAGTVKNARVLVFKN